MVVGRAGAAGGGRRRVAGGKGRKNTDGKICVVGSVIAVFGISAKNKGAVVSLFVIFVGGGARKAKVLAARRATVSQAAHVSTQKGGMAWKAIVFRFPIAIQRLLFSSMMYPPWRRGSPPLMFIIIV